MREQLAGQLDRFRNLGVDCGARQDVEGWMARARVAYLLGPWRQILDHSFVSCTHTVTECARFGF